MNKIKDVRIRNTSVKNISCLAGKQELEQVLMDASLVDDISPLTGLKTLNNSDDLSNGDVDNEGKPLDKESENDLFYMCMAIVGIVIVFVVIYQIGIRRGKKDREEEKDINNMLG